MAALYRGAEKAIRDGIAAAVDAGWGQEEQPTRKGHKQVGGGAVGLFLATVL